MKSLIAILGVTLCSFPVLSAQAQESATAKANVILPLWPEGKMPGRGTKDGGVEKEAPSRGDGVTRITNVSEPTALPGLAWDSQLAGNGFE